MPSSITNSNNVQLARDELAKLGISIGFSESGLVELTSRNGVRCTYSSRVYSPAIGFGADGRISARLVDRGFAQLRINGEQFDYRLGDASLQMTIPKIAPVKTEQNRP